MSTPNVPNPIREADGEVPRPLEAKSNGGSPIEPAYY